MGAVLEPDKEDCMYRPKSTSVIVSAAALLGLALIGSACPPPPEEPLLRQFFRASQLRDNATLANFSAATFDPRTDGVVSGFDIVSVGEERRQPLMLKELAATADQARIADERNSKKRKGDQDANLAAIERVLKAETAGQPVAGRDAAVQGAWRRGGGEASASSKVGSDARGAR